MVEDFFDCKYFYVFNGATSWLRKYFSKITSNFLWIFTRPLSSSNYTVRNGTGKEKESYFVSSFVSLKNYSKNRRQFDIINQYFFVIISINFNLPKLYIAHFVC